MLPILCSPKSTTLRSLLSILLKSAEGNRYPSIEILCNFLTLSQLISLYSSFLRFTFPRGFTFPQMSQLLAFLVTFQHPAFELMEDFLLKFEPTPLLRNTCSRPVPCTD